MLKYVLKRLLFFIPTLIAISLLAFFISVNAPGDSVTRLIETSQSGTEYGAASAHQKEQRKYWVQKLGLDLPVFYFSIHSLAEPDTFYKIDDKAGKYALQRLADKYGNWNEISSYYQSIQILYSSFENVEADSLQIKEALNTSMNLCSLLKSEWKEELIISRIDSLQRLYSAYPFFENQKLLLNNVKDAFNRVKDNTTPWKNYIPVVSFYGDNQYHRWIFGDGNWITAEGSRFSEGVIRGDFGVSYVTKESISRKLGSRILWSLLFAILSVIIAYLISIPIGMRSAVKKDKAFDHISSVILYFFYSMPVFWLATMMLMSFANPDALWIFPASGVKPVTGYPEEAGLWNRIIITIPYLILPLICYVYSSVAFLSRTIRASVLEVLPVDYIRTARAKGLTEKKVIYGHAFRNSLLPLITIFANVFPLAIGGSVIIESIFSIPGMGQEAYSAVSSQDYPVIVAVFTLTGLFTLLGYLLSDILYAWADPRIRLEKK
jgi:peptide/nickel transport system permease protein